MFVDSDSGGNSKDEDGGEMEQNSSAVSSEKVRKMRQLRSSVCVAACIATSAILYYPFWCGAQNSEDPLTKEQLAQYKELDQRRQRLKELERVSAKMQTKKNLTVRE